jgi:hypothetical protein
MPKKKAMSEEYQDPNLRPIKVEKKKPVKANSKLTDTWAKEKAKRSTKKK